MVTSKSKANCKNSKMTREVRNTPYPSDVLKLQKSPHNHPSKRKISCCRINYHGMLKQTTKRNKWMHNFRKKGRLQHWNDRKRSEKEAFGGTFARRIMYTSTDQDPGNFDTLRSRQRGCDRFSKGNKFKAAAPGEIHSATFWLSAALAAAYITQPYNDTKRERKVPDKWKLSKWGKMQGLV